MLHLSLLAKSIPVCVCQRGKKQVITVLITWRFKEAKTKEHASRQETQSDLQPGTQEGM